ncbi:MAG: PQQ-dependent sugar dehydrogenase [Verrucomicrobiales bacterium]
MRPSQTAHSLLAASAALALALSSGVAGAAAADGDSDSDGDPSLNPLRYSARSLIEGMAQPMEFEVAPDGRIFIIELGGKVKLLKPDGAVLLAAEIEVFAAQENGLLGLALDPAFAANGWLYLMYSPPNFDGQRISRFTVEGDALDRKSETVILEWGTQRHECCHHAGCMEFGPDGNLYAATGDNTHPHADSGGYAPIDERPDRGPWDAQKSAANPGDLRGKILRIKPKPEGGCEIPPGNLFPPGTPGTRPEIYAMGCRNPWRMTIDPATGFVYWGEVGPDAGGDSERGPRGYDEINQARGPGNHGWPYFIADNQPYADFDYVAMKAGPRFDPAKPRNRRQQHRAQGPAARRARFHLLYVWQVRALVGAGRRRAHRLPASAVFHFKDSFRETGGFPERYDGCLLFFDWQR